MCEFISWVAVHKRVRLRSGKYENITKYYYLTDAEVFSGAWKEIMRDSKDNDCLGHGAIRKFYGLRHDTGMDCERRDFWRPLALPEEIAEKARHFHKHWGRMLAEGRFQEDDLAYVIQNGPKSIARKFAEQLLKQAETLHHLHSIVCSDLETDLRAKAAEIYFSEAPGEFNHSIGFNCTWLANIVIHLPRPWSAKAWKLISANPELISERRADELLRIVNQAPRPWSTEARGMILDAYANGGLKLEFPDINDLIYMYRGRNPAMTLLAELMLEWHPFPFEIMGRIMPHVSGNMQVRLWRAMIREGADPTDYEEWLKPDLMNPKKLNPKYSRQLRIAVRESIRKSKERRRKRPS